MHVTVVKETQGQALLTSRVERLLKGDFAAFVDEIEHRSDVGL